MRCILDFQCHLPLAGAAETVLGSSEPVTRALAAHWMAAVSFRGAAPLVAGFVDENNGSDLPGRYSEAAWGGRPESVARFTVSLSPKVTMFFGTKAILDNDELSGFTTYCTLGVSLVESPSWIP
jgi:hypothetical protein